jgi:hypothetical protein
MPNKNSFQSISEEFNRFTVLFAKAMQATALGRILFPSQPKTIRLRLA